MGNVFTFISQWLNFQPGVRPVLASTLTRTPAPVRAVSSPATALLTDSRSSSFLTIGTMTTCGQARSIWRRTNNALFEHDLHR